MKTSMKGMALAGLLTLATAGLTSPVSAYQTGTWTSLTCTNATGNRGYSQAQKTAYSTINSTGGTCYTGAIAYCSRANGGIKGYQSSGNTIAQGQTTYDCDSNGTYNFALTGNTSITSTSDFSSGCYSSC